MKFLNTIWQDIRQGENIDSYIAIIVALGLSIANVFGLAPQALLGSITLAVLALLAITNLGNRHRLDMVLNQRDSEFFMKKLPESVQGDIEKAKETWLFGYNLTRTIVNYSTLLDEKLERGEKVKILLLDPNGNSLTYANKTLYYPMTDEQHRERIHTTLSNLQQISRSNKSNLEIRLVDFPFAFGVYAMDMMSSGGKIYIKTYEYKTKADGPRILLTPRDEYWYEYYKNQILALWNDAKPYEP
ncbi:MAG: hypothetical protein IPP66_16785 [Anaerolineales bacterium]|nr:hypothetical protein [Anaerolineales bacterium]